MPFAGAHALLYLWSRQSTDGINIGGVVGGAVGVILAVAILISRRASGGDTSAPLSPNAPLVFTPETREAVRERLIRLEQRRQELLAEIAAEVGAEIYMSRVAGVTHRNPDRTSRQAELRRCEPFESLTLVRDPENKFDPNAIEVVSERGRCIGYLPAETARWVADSMRVGGTWHAVVYSVDEVDRDDDDLKPVLGARIALLKCGLPEMQ